MPTVVLTRLTDLPNSLSYKLEKKIFQLLDYCPMFLPNLLGQSIFLKK